LVAAYARGVPAEKRNEFRVHGPPDVLTDDVTTSIADAPTSFPATGIET